MMSIRILEVILSSAAIVKSSTCHMERTLLLLMTPEYRHGS